MSLKKVVFIGEGNAEKVLLRSFGIPFDPNHGGTGSSGISAFMQKRQSIPDLVIVGLTDKDKNKPLYFDLFEEINRENNLILKKHPSFEFYLVFVCPAFEAWLLKAAQATNIHPQTYGLPDTPKELHKVTKSMGLEKNKEYKEFFAKIHEANPLAFQIMIKWLKDLKKMGYEDKHSK